MAKRPIYTPEDSFPFVSEQLTEFKWHAGFAVSQKQKSIEELHSAAIESLSCVKPLEVSSKSGNPIGVELSAFNLKVQMNNGKEFSVENIFQSSKVFENGGPFIDLRCVSPKEAKRDSRLKKSGDLTGFMGKGFIWPLEPKTLFYDWIYLNALHQNIDLVEEVKLYDAFTDIEFNPKKSFNCQARSVALYVGLAKSKLLDSVIGDQDAYRKILGQTELRKQEQLQIQFF
ncbi:DarT1-associated NADAR antitoxin family protein [Vibrio rotiferianus]|uniref:DarT1-associated NADAR antitoxin family protein n=1 Tax=Vibrio rotiferianus TaxID=190895 RepID=UPI00406AA626